ncbi:alpha/beta fold hydrolase [Actinomadura roseirufa]|uniref:alpha/beta fold hydrolase n=1 Tax=Actinomadura roseirufa TaxID=2094049 RepID=UPI001041A240|nr:alpha/beta hydrolase [Actinomadura roseirufa]
MTTVTIGNARIPYRVHGSGPTLVLVHGAGPGSGMWDYLLDRFTGRTLILPDLSGSDAAEDDGAPLTIETLAEQVIAVIEDVDAGPVDLVGFSLGASVVAAAAALRPDLVRRLIPINGLATSDDEYVQQIMTTWLTLAGNAEGFGRYGTLTAYSRSHMNEIGHDSVEQSHGFMSPTEGQLRHLDLLLRIDLRELLPKIEARTLVIGCTHDQTLPVENHRELHAGIPGAEYTELDSGHVVLAERTDEFVKVIQDFLDRP